ncbi:MAG: hypothetical protein HYT39_02440 [Candidatus Sungbacteria bacterium]|nr:hypothetical protein [Candidatus Sungbacteria bacterium]
MISRHTLEGHMDVREVKVRPAIYHLVGPTTERMPVMTGERPMNWGWEKLSELSEIAGTRGTDLVMEFICIRPWRLGSREGGSITLAIPDSPDGFVMYGRGEKFLTRGCWGSGPLYTVAIEEAEFRSYLDKMIASHEVFVPAGWAIAVLEDMMKIRRRRDDQRHNDEERRRREEASQFG